MTRIFSKNGCSAPRGGVPELLPSLRKPCPTAAYVLKSQILDVPRHACGLRFCARGPRYGQDFCSSVRISGTPPSKADARDQAEIAWFCGRARLQRANETRGPYASAFLHLEPPSAIFIPEGQATPGGDLGPGFTDRLLLRCCRFLAAWGVTPP